MSAAVDPAFAAVDRVAAAHRAQSLAAAVLDAITEQLAAEGAARGPLVQLEFAGEMLTLRSRKAINRIFRRARENQNGEAPALAVAEAALLDAFERERQRVERARIRLGFVEAEQHVARCSQGLCSALNAAARTVPTSPAGLRALIETVGNPAFGDRAHLTAALVSLRVAAKALLPEGEQ